VHTSSGYRKGATPAKPAQVPQPIVPPEPTQAIKQSKRLPKKVATAPKPVMRLTYSSHYPEPSVPNNFAAKSEQDTKKKIY